MVDAVTATVDHCADGAVDTDPQQVVDAQAPLRWPRFALAALLIGTAALYLWNLSANGFANAFYAAAAQAGAQSWSAWFFGSLDAQNFMTVDKPPAALWVTGLSVRLFGMNSAAVLVPQALMGVACVAVLYATVRRAVPDPRLGVTAGLLAGLVCAVTPSATLIFRYNNPDALMTLLMVAGAYCLTRALRSASWRWMAMTGVALGFAFLTKMFAGLLVLPAFGAAYLLFAPTSWGKRLRDLMIAALALVVSAGWWVLAIQLCPASARPYVDNSTDDSVLDLAFGYNGLHRLHSGNNHAHAGVQRLLRGEMGYEISWLLPVVLCTLGFGIHLAARQALSRSERAALVLWGSWVLICAAVFSYMDGMAHPYYTVAMAPAVGALVGLGAVWAWRRRSGWDGVVALTAMILLAAGWATILLHRADLGPAWTRWLIAGGAIAGVVGLGFGARRRPRITALAAAAGLLASLSGSTAFAVATAATPHTGAIPSAVHTALGWPTVGKRFGPSVSFLTGNLQTNEALGAALRATTTPFSAATTGSQAASALEIASGTSVLAIGGWSDDPVPTLQQFIDDVHAGKIGYYVDAGHIHSRTTTGIPIADWVAGNYRPTLIGGTRVYRLN